MPSRLIDKLLTYPRVTNEHKQLLLNSRAITADNVTDYYFEMTGNAYDRFALLPSISPPFSNIFIQYRAGSKGIEHGSLVLSEKTKLKGQPERLLIRMQLMWDDPVDPYIGDAVVLLNPDGTIAHLTTGGFAVEYGVFDDWRNAHSEITDDDISVLVAMDMTIALWTLAFMNTKNVVMEAVEPNAKENKQRQKHGKLPLMRYHVLKIKPMGRAANDDQGGTHASPALHIRRGHFKTYTDAAPLFGKYVGTFWVDQHIAGKKSDRVVVKDYEVEAPAEG